MDLTKLEIVEKLDLDDKKKISYFVGLLLSKSRYKKLRDEILSRRKEIEKKEIYSHEEIWDKLNV